MPRQELTHVWVMQASIPTLDPASVGGVHSVKSSSSNSSRHLVSGQLPHAVLKIFPHRGCILDFRVQAAFEDNACLSCVHQRAYCSDDVTFSQLVVPIPVSMTTFDHFCQVV